MTGITIGCFHDQGRPAPRPGPGLRTKESQRARPERPIGPHVPSGDSHRDRDHHHLRVPASLRRQRPGKPQPTRPLFTLKQDGATLPAGRGSPLPVCSSPTIEDFRQERRLGALRPFPRLSGPDRQGNESPYLGPNVRTPSFPVFRNLFS
jgi:hypothetical protein